MAAGQICHYDVKPGNVLLDKARMQAKISDVGLSKVILGSQASQATLVRPLSAEGGRG